MGLWGACRRKGTSRGGPGETAQYHRPVYEQAQTGTRASALPLRAQVLLLAAMAVASTWVGIGSSGISQSEGHRAIPGWEMLRRGEWLITSMFEQVYLRKPPGMPWAVALSSLVLGETEFAARAVSALATTAGAMLTLLYAARWFGSAWGLRAGAAYLLLPLFWAPGRSAEIEALHNTFTLATVLLVIDALLHRASWRTLIAAGLALAGMILTKGPAGLPCVGAAVGACVLVQGWGQSRRTAVRLCLTATLGLGAVGLFALLAAARLRGMDASPVLEPPSRFLWRPDRIGQVLLLPIAAIVSAMPHGLALAAVPALPPLACVRADRAGRAAAWALALSLIFYMVLGVSNPRYAMPALTLTPLVVVFALCRASAGLAPARGWPAAMVRAAPALACVLAVGVVGHAVWFEHRRETRTSGREIGRALGETLEDGSQIWADDLIDTRPEVLYYARQRAAELGRQVRPLWMPRRQGAPLPMPADGHYLALRDDDWPRDLLPPEVPQYEAAGLLTGQPIVFEGPVHKFHFRVYQIRGAEPRAKE